MTKIFKPKKISIIIPVYNEKDFIRETLKKVFEANTFGLKKEIIIVDDASTDGTVKELNRLKEKRQAIKIIFKNVNQGKGSALKSGFLKSSGDIVLIQDADLEYSPQDYPRLLEPFFQENADCVYGSRFISDRPHRVLYFWHFFMNQALTTFSNIFTNLNLTDMETGYKVFKGELIRKIAPLLTSKRFGFEPEITARIAKIKAIEIYEVGISYQGRTYEKGKKIGWRDGVRAIWEIVRYNLFTN